MEASVADNTGLAHEEHGVGFPVVFIHGLTFDRGTWRPIIDRLADRFRCIAIDLPGHGETDGLPQSMDEVGRQVGALVTDLGIDRPVMIGHSLGASLASIIAASSPVAGVVNVDQPLDIMPLARVVHQMAPALRGPNFAVAFEPIRRSIGVEMLLEPLRSSTLAAQTVRQDLVLAYWRDMLERTPEELQAIVDDATKQIRVPYLAVFGHELSEEERRRLHDRLPTLQLEEWLDRGHMVHLMESERFADRVAAFLTRCHEAS
jgi:pimeloyl-ACP methyl ester carboxylesterase